MRLILTGGRIDRIGLTEIVWRKSLGEGGGVFTAGVPSPFPSLPSPPFLSHFLSFPSPSPHCRYWYNETTPCHRKRLCFSYLLHNVFLKESWSLPEGNWLYAKVSVISLLSKFYFPRFSKLKFRRVPTSLVEIWPKCRHMIKLQNNVCEVNVLLVFGSLC